MSLHAETSEQLNEQSKERVQEFMQKRELVSPDAYREMMKRTMTRTGCIPWLVSCSQGRLHLYKKGYPLIVDKILVYDGIEPLHPFREDLYELHALEEAVRLAYLAGNVFGPDSFYQDFGPRNKVEKMHEIVTNIRLSIVQPVGKDIKMVPIFGATKQQLVDTIGSPEDQIKNDLIDPEWKFYEGRRAALRSAFEEAKRKEREEGKRGLAGQYAKSNMEMAGLYMQALNPVAGSIELNEMLRLYNGSSSD